MNISLQSTSNVTLKSLIFPSSYAMFKCCSSVEEGKEKLLKLLSSRHFVCCLKSLSAPDPPINNTGLVLP